MLITPITNTCTSLARSDKHEVIHIQSVSTMQHSELPIPTTSLFLTIMAMLLLGMRATIIILRFIPVLGLLQNLRDSSLLFQPRGANHP